MVRRQRQICRRDRSIRWAGGEGYGPGVERRRSENVSEAARNGEDMDMDMDKCILERGTGGNCVGALDMECEYKLSLIHTSVPTRQVEIPYAVSSLTNSIVQIQDFTDFV